MAGALGVTGEGGGIGSTIATAFVGNTFSGISDTLTHVLTGNLGAAYGDFGLGGTRQGIPGSTSASGSGIVGVLTDAGVAAVSSPGSVLSGVTGAATSLGEESLAGPVGIAKVGIDLATYLGAAAYCANHQ